MTEQDALDILNYYNAVRLHSAIAYVTPQDMPAERQAEIHAARDSSATADTLPTRMLTASKYLLG